MPPRATGTIEVRGGKAFARLRIAGKRERVCVDHVPEAQRKAVAAEMQRRADAGDLDLSKIRDRSGPRARTCAHVIESWFESRAARKMTSVPADRSRWRFWCTDLHDALPSDLTRAKIEAHVRGLDVAVSEGKISWKTARNIWGLTSRFCHDLARSKDPRVRCLDVNPAAGVEPPYRGESASRCYLYPREMEALLACDAVPVRWLVTYALAAYTYTRAGELDALTWADVDEKAGVIRIHRANNRRTGESKTTKSGKVRTISIEPSLSPLLAVLRRPAGNVCRVPQKGQGWRLREHLRVAGVTRDSLFADTDTENPLTLHDLRGSGITWQALRGDDALKIQRRAGHASFATTQLYVREAENLTGDVGVPFPPIPHALIVRAHVWAHGEDGTVPQPQTSTKTEPTMGFEGTTKEDISATCEVTRDRTKTPLRKCLPDPHLAALDAEAALMLAAGDE